MATLARMHVELIARTDAFLRDMDKAQAKIKKTASGFVEAGKAIAAGWVVREIIKNTAEAEAAFAQLTAAVKSTGGAAGFSAEQLREQAGAMQQVSTFSDEAVEHMQAVLLTFTKVRGDNFTRASAAIADMATRMGTDLKSAALQVGKALQDPVKGATALARAGVQLSESQKAAIADLVKLGDVAGAQRIILKELEVQFGGSAAAARNTLGGALTAVKNAFGDALEAGSGFSGGMTRAFNALAEAIPKVRKVFDDFLTGFELIALDLGIAWAKFTSSFMQRIGTLLVAVGKFGNVMGKVIPPLKLLAAPAVAAGQKILADHINETTEALAIYRAEQIKLILGIGQQKKATGAAVVTETAFGKVVDANTTAVRDYAKALKEITDDPELGGNLPSAGGTGLLGLPPVEELKPALGEIRREIKKTWMDSARDFADSFVDVLTGPTLVNQLQGSAQELGGIFGNRFGTFAGQFAASAMVSIVSETLNALGEVLSVFFGGSGGITGPNGIVTINPDGSISTRDPVSGITVTDRRGTGGITGTGMLPFGPMGDPLAKGPDKIGTGGGRRDDSPLVQSTINRATAEGDNRIIGLLTSILAEIRGVSSSASSIARRGPVFSDTVNQTGLTDYTAGDLSAATA